MPCSSLDPETSEGPPCDKTTHPPFHPELMEQVLLLDVDDERVRERTLSFLRVNISAPHKIIQVKAGDKPQILRIAPS